MSNTKTKALIGTATASVLAIGATVAHADTKPVETPATETPNVTEVVKPTATAETTPTTGAETKTAETPATQVTETPATPETVATAQAEYNTAQADVDTQATAVSNAQSSVDSAKQGVSDAQTEVSNAENLVKEATPENVAKTETKISNLQDEKGKSEASVKAEQSEIAKANEEKAKQETVVKTAQENVSNAQANVNSAKENVQNAKNILDGTGATEVIAKAEKTQAVQDKAQAEKDASEKVLNDAKKHDAERQANIDNQTSTISNTNNTIKQTETALSNAQTDEANVKTSVSNTQTALTKAQNDVNAYPKFYVSEEYVNALKVFHDSKVDSPEYNSAVAKLKSINLGLINQNKFQANANDSSKLIDLNSMSAEDQAELTQYANAISNQIRGAFGTQPTVVTPMSMAFAKSVADNYVADNWSWENVSEKGHDVNAISKAAKDNGYYSNGSSNLYENLTTSSGSLKSATMSDLKAKVYGAFLSFMYNGYEWMHALSISGLNYADNQEAKNFQLGVSLSSRDTANSVHVITAPDYAYSGEKENNVIANTYDLNALKSAQASAQANYDSAKADYSAKQKATASLKGQLEKAQTDLKSQTEKLAVLKNVAILTPNAQKDFDAKVAVLATASEENRKAQDAVKVLNADIQTKKANLEKAQANLKTQEAVLKTAQDKLATEQATLKSITDNIAKHEQAKAGYEAKVKELSAQISETQGYLEKLKNAPTLLKQAQAKLEKAKAELKDAETKLKAEQEKLAELEKVRDTKKATYEELATKLAKQEEAKRQAELEAQRQAIEASGNIATPTFDETGKIVGYQSTSTNSANSKAVQVNYNLSTNSKQAKATDKELPSTGSKASNLGILGIFTVMFAMFIAKRKRTDK